MDAPNRVDICPNGHNIGCFVMREGEDLQAELEGSLLSGYQEAEITEVYFDRTGIKTRRQRVECRLQNP